MAYKAKINWRDYEAGDVVPDDVAEKLLSKYVKFEQQDILLKVSEASNKKVENKVSVQSPKDKKTGMSELDLDGDGDFDKDDKSIAARVLATKIKKKKSSKKKSKK